MPGVESSYNVLFSDIAEADFGALSKADQKKILSLAERMLSQPFAGAAKLKYIAAEVWRKKLGRLRVLFTVDKVARLVVIRVIDLRDDDTYDKRVNESLGWVPPAEGC